MNYRNIYKQLIQKRLKQPANLFFNYTQNHHIVPKSYKPEWKNNKNNIVNLSAREHFIAHALLVKIAKQQNNIILFQKMLHAFNVMTTFKKNMMSIQQYRKFDECISKLYQKWRIQRSKIIHQTGCLKGIKGKYIIIYIKQLEKQIYIKQGSKIPRGWRRGRLPKYTKARIQAIKDGKIKNTKGQRRIYNLTTFQMKNIHQNQQLPEGWAYGLSPKIRQKRISPTQDKHWITNIQTYEYKLINKNEEIPQGWTKGKLIKSQKEKQNN